MKSPEDKNEMPKEEMAGDVDWEKLEAKQKREDNRKKEEYDEEKVKGAVKNLSEDEKALPYPDDFLADINLLSEDIKNQKVEGEEDLGEEGEEEDDDE